MTFFLQSAQPLATGSTPWLKWSWCLLGGSIVMTLVSLAPISPMHWRAVTYFTDLLLQKQKPVLSSWRELVRLILRSVSLALLVIGISLVAMFGLKNVSARETERTRQSNAAKEVTSPLKQKPKDAVAPPSFQDFARVSFAPCE